MIQCFSVHFSLMASHRTNFYQTFVHLLDMVKAQTLLLTFQVNLLNFYKNKQQIFPVATIKFIWNKQPKAEKVCNFSVRGNKSLGHIL